MDIHKDINWIRVGNLSIDAYDWKKEKKGQKSVGKCFKKNTININGDIQSFWSFGLK